MATTECTYTGLASMAPVTPGDTIYETTMCIQSFADHCHEILWLWKPPFSSLGFKCLFFCTQIITVCHLFYKNNNNYSLKKTLKFVAWVAIFPCWDLLYTLSQGIAFIFRLKDRDDLGVFISVFMSLTCSTIPEYSVTSGCDWKVKPLKVTQR